MRWMKRCLRVGAVLAPSLGLALMAGAHGEAPPGDPPPNDAALSNVECTAGFADIYPCSNVDLLAFVPLSVFGAGDANDLWGWTDPVSGDEIVILGLRDGVAFVDVTDPTAPVHLGFLPSHTDASVWNDVKVYGDFAFVVSEATGHGMQVFDLTRLAGVTTPPETFAADARYGGFGDAHNVFVNEETGYAFAAGANSCLRGLHMMDVSDPLAATFAGCFSEDGYSHDVQCVVYQGPDLDHSGDEICFASNTDTLTVVDVTDKSSPVMLSRTGYAGTGYTHQGWLTEDQRNFLLSDELDELDFGHPARTYVWDVTDLEAPVLVGHHDGATSAIDHNHYVLGSHLFQANYRGGVRVLRLGNLSLAEMTEIAYFDTWPADDTPAFSGVWSVYPYFASGTVAASDITAGLFLLHPHLEDVPECDDGIDNDSDGSVDGADPGCDLGPTDLSEHSAALSCDNGLDDDGDGAADFPADAGCYSATSSSEAPQCQDGINNDPGQDALIDFDGGQSAGLPPGEQTAPDPQCSMAWVSRESGASSSCGLGFELAVLIPILRTLRRRRRSRR